MSSLVAELVARGIVEENPRTTGADGLRSLGRPAVVVSMAPNARYAVGVDIGHDHVRVALCGLLGGIVAESEARREVDLAPHETLDLAASRVRQALTEHTIDTAAVIGLGMGIAAPVHTGSGRIEASGIMPGWVGINPVQEMHSRTGLNVHVINDADAGALGEHSYGAGRGVDDLLYVRLSAGIGAGVIAGGRSLSGSAGLAGELGHVHVVENGPICRCGNRGCLETVASPVAIAHLLSQSWHRPVTGQELMHLVEEGDPGACRAVEDAAATRRPGHRRRRQPAQSPARRHRRRPRPGRRATARPDPHRHPPQRASGDRRAGQRGVWATRRACGGARRGQPGPRRRPRAPHRAVGGTQARLSTCRWRRSRHAPQPPGVPRHQTPQAPRHAPRQPQFALRVRYPVRMRAVRLLLT